MITRQKQLHLDAYLIELIKDQTDMNDCFLVDIETTGFSAELSKIYLIGCIYSDGNDFHLIQWLCEKNEDEYELLYKFSHWIRRFKSAVHYNGTSFDFPFIKKRLHKYNISSRISDLIEIDLYTHIRPFQRHFNLGNLKLKTVENFFGYNRIDTFDGGTLINIYLDFIKKPTTEIEVTLLLHNEEDLLGLFQSLKAYERIHFIKLAQAKQISILNLTAHKGQDTLKLSMPYPTLFNAQLSLGSYILEVETNSITLIIPILENTLNYYYPNYKDYFFLPMESQVIHKSVAQFVEKEHKTKATKENCYIKKRGTFIPLINNFNTTYYTFKNHYKDQQHFLELTDQLLLNQEFLSQLMLEALSTL